MATGADGLAALADVERHDAGRRAAPSGSRPRPPPSGSGWRCCSTASPAPGGTSAASSCRCSSAAPSARSRCSSDRLGVDGAVALRDRRRRRASDSRRGSASGTSSARRSRCSAPRSPRSSARSAGSGSRSRRRPHRDRRARAGAGGGGGRLLRDAAEAEPGRRPCCSSRTRAARPASPRRCSARSSRSTTGPAGDWHAEWQPLRELLRLAVESAVLADRVVGDAAACTPTGRAANLERLPRRGARGARAAGAGSGRSAGPGPPSSCGRRSPSPSS